LGGRRGGPSTTAPLGHEEVYIFGGVGSGGAMVLLSGGTIVVGIDTLIHINIDSFVYGYSDICYFYSDIYTCICI